MNNKLKILMSILFIIIISIFSGQDVFAQDKEVTLTLVKDMAAGEHHSLALSENGELWAWGDNSRGQLGDGTLIGKSTPTKVKNIDNVIAIACGDYFSMAVKNDGTIWVCGDNEKGLLNCSGSNDKHILTPSMVQGLDGAIAVAGGEEHCLVLKNDGTVWAWEAQSYGQTESITEENRPDEVYGIDKKVVTIHAKGSYSILIDENKNVWVTRSKTDLFYKISSSLDVKDIMPERHKFINHCGELGNGIDTFQEEPVRVLINNNLERGSVNQIKVFINGEEVIFDVLPVNVNGRVLVPFRIIFEKLGGQVNWEEETKTIIAEKNNARIVLKVGSKEAFVNGIYQELDVSPAIYGDRAFIPLRFISENLSSKVNWDANTNSIMITNR